jgi:SPP1 family predicted phage head-tail adaptor
MQAGRLRHRITAQEDEGTEDSAGQVIPNWQTWLANEPAEVIETGGAETLRGQAIQATASHVVRVRYRDGYHEEMRLLWGTRILGVVSVRDIDGRRRELWLGCQERR